MNKKGNIFIGIVIALLVFMSGFLFIEHFKTEITSARISLQCSSPDLISDGTKLTCLLMDGLLPYYIVGLISISIGALVGAKLT